MSRNKKNITWICQEIRKILWRYSLLSVAMSGMFVSCFPMNQSLDKYNWEDLKIYVLGRSVKEDIVNLS